jgi:L,D-transpeptidase YcbB
VAAAMRGRAGRGGLLGIVTRAFALTVVAACGRAPEPPSLAAQASEIATVFETPVPYTTRRLDSLDLAAFLARHPMYRGDSAQMADFYARRDMQYAWLIGDSLTASADAFIALAGVADSMAPGAAEFADRLREIHDDGIVEGRRIAHCDTCATETELRLTGEFFRFAARNYGGHFGRDLRQLAWFIPRAKKDASRLLDSLAAGTMDLSAYEPMHPQYQLLRGGIQRTRDLADLPWPALALPRGTRTLEHGDSLGLVAGIRERLRLLGDLDRDDGSAVFDSALVRGVQRFQLRHGLASDGVVGPNVLGALNVPPAERLRTMLVNMERLRWVPEHQPPNALVVNIPEFRLRVFEDDREVMSMRIVVGAHATRTVIFTATLTTLVLSPTWTVPASITRNEVLPAMRRDPAYLRRNNMEIVGGTDAAPVIRQRPGADNALGRVKFVFPNSYGIFMHDTPARSLFERDQRAFSHGCIRLSQPRELAEYLLRNDPAWPPDRMLEVMLSERETSVPLRERRPVMVVYFTSWVDREGLLHFREDVYGHDRRLAAELFR